MLKARSMRFFFLLSVCAYSFHYSFQFAFDISEQLLKEVELQMEALKTITNASSKANGAFLALIGKDFYSMFKVRTF
jgi:hypothetical protein